MLTSWKESISHLVFDALKLAESSKDLPKVSGILNFDKIIDSISKPRDSENGDISTNIAFFVSKKIKSNPNIVGKIIQEKISKLILQTETSHNSSLVVERVEFATPGFVNFGFLAKQNLR